MTQDPCAHARQELANAEKQLQDHQANPMNWEGESAEKGKDELKRLQAEVEQKQQALQDCEASK
jgi:hypothetical protein